MDTQQYEEYIEYEHREREILEDRSCDTCQHYIEGVQLTKGLWTIDVCKIKGITEPSSFCKAHQHHESFWDDAYLREIVEPTEFIKEEEMTL